MKRLEVNKLERLRSLFLKPDEVLRNHDYWEDRALIELYDETLAQRIGWKWDLVLKELLRLSWKPPAVYQLMSWGCGSAIEVRSYLLSFGHSLPAEILLWDRSRLALEVAKSKINSTHRDVPVKVQRRFSSELPCVLLLSHVANELTPAAERELQKLVQRAELILWVEPGTKATSQILISFRELLSKTFIPLLPCPHTLACGLSGRSQKHWCHFIDEAPSEIHQSEHWSDIRRELKIDVGTLAYSYLVLRKKTLLEEEHPLCREPRKLGSKHEELKRKSIYCRPDGSIGP